MHSFSFIFPGQGAQYPGMGKTFFDNFKEAKEVYLEADEILHRPLSKTIFSGSEAELTETKTSQPAIFVTSLAILKALQQHLPLPVPLSVSGLSLGEYTALVAGGYMNFKEALEIVALRGQLMHDACEKNKGSMKVVLGLADEVVEEVVRGLHLPQDIWCANFNCPGQVVISGTEKGLNAAEEPLKAAGAKRVLPLQVHGAFHSGLMKPAEKGLSTSIENAHIHSSPVKLAMNVSGSFENSPERIKELLIRQVTSPVRWHKCISSALSLNPTHFIEMGPGKTLQGMNKRIGVTQPTISIETVEDIKALEEIFSS